jgi:tetratricopeptide (TPR) repeat protein
VGELVWAQQRRRALRTRIDGMRGTIQRLLLAEEAAGVVLDLGFGVGYFPDATASLKDVPPTRFPAGTRVTTPYGPGVTAEPIRFTPTSTAAGGAPGGRLDYVVDILVDAVGMSLWATAPATPAAAAATGGGLGRTMRCYLEPSGVVQREWLTKREMALVTEDARRRGNEALKAKEWDAALECYDEAIQTFAKRNPALDAEATAAAGEEGGAAAAAAAPASEPEELAVKWAVFVRSSAVKAISNMVQVYISKPGPPSVKDTDKAIRCATQGLAWDSGNEAGQRDKLLYRRAVALMNAKEYTLAAEDLKDASLASNASAQAKLREALALAKKESEQQRKLWSSAFAKASSTPAPAATTGSGAVAAAEEPAESSKALAKDAGKSLGASSSVAGKAPRPQGTSTMVLQAGDEEDEEEEEEGGWRKVLKYGAIAAGALAVGGAIYLAAKNRSRLR